MVIGVGVSRGNFRWFFRTEGRGVFSGFWIGVRFIGLLVFVTRACGFREVRL